MRWDTCQGHDDVPRVAFLIDLQSVGARLGGQALDRRVALVRVGDSFFLF